MPKSLSALMIVVAPVAGYALRLAVENGALPPLDELAALGLVTAAGWFLWERFRRRARQGAARR